MTETEVGRGFAVEIVTACFLLFELLKVLWTTGGGGTEHDHNMREREKEG